ncbi:MAG TPA: hypothetical protein VFH68_21535 [Polyangia bacterium]|jgi:tetratricopeptide (TPR) repeat protein|nr:hypothetical protein [Polyangia bacterium]
MSVLSVRGARADDEADQARAFHEKAKAAFALSHYGQAAEFFEKAFELKSDPALLYNAAQSHRLAGNKDRALTLYQNYLHVYGRDDRRAQIESRIDELKKSIERDRREIPARPPAGWPPGTSPPPPSSSDPGSAPAGEPIKPAPPMPRIYSSAPVGPPPPPVEPPPPPLPSALTPPPAPSPSTSPPVLLSQSGAPSEEDKALTQKPWFWIAVGGGVVAAAAVVLLVTLGGSKDPSASLGQAHGN